VITAVGAIAFTAAALWALRSMLKGAHDLGYTQGQAESTWNDVDYDLAWKDGYQSACGDFIRDQEAVVAAAEQITREAAR
jgi:hypothetical protein